jgi:hypothetical protein
MNGARAGLSLGVIVALAVAIWAAVSSGDESPPTSSSTSTSTTATTATTTTVPSTTSSATSTPDTTADPEARVEEVRLILEDLYFRWFDAIYRNDEEAVRTISATSNNIDDFHRAVETLELPSAPEREDIVVRDVEVLHDDPTCLVSFSVLDVSAWQGAGAVTDGVNVLLPVAGEWRFGTAWENKNDLWESDCLIEPDLP